MEIPTALLLAFVCPMHYKFWEIGSYDANTCGPYMAGVLALILIVLCFEVPRFIIDKRKEMTTAKEWTFSTKWMVLLILLHLGRVALYGCAIAMLPYYVWIIGHTLLIICIECSAFQCFEMLIFNHPLYRPDFE